jgi:hypothetical protein
VKSLESAQTVYFSGRLSDIDQLRALVGEAAAAEQAAHGYTPPALCDLPAIPSACAIAADAPEVLPAAVRRRVPLPLTDIAVIGGQSKILEQQQILEIRKRLPRRNRNGDWRLLFQLSTDGCSYQTMYDKVGQSWPVVIAVRTDVGDRIGAFLSSELKVSRGYYGQPDSFVWRIKDTVEMFGGAGPPPNRFFVACTNEEIMIGGGNGAAIHVGEMLDIGRSRPCVTYGSPMLTQKERFQVIELEVWLVMKADSELRRASK